MCEEQQSGWTAESLRKFLEGETLKERSGEFCGGIHLRPTIEGGATTGVHRCHDHRNCQFCFNIRKNEFESRLTSDKLADDLIFVVCTEDMAKRLTKSRKTVADDYLRSPTEDGMVLVAISKDMADKVKGFDYSQCRWSYLKDENGKIDDVVIEAFANIPVGKRTSGNLGKLELKLKEKEDRVIPQPLDDTDHFEYDYPVYAIAAPEEITINDMFMTAVVESSACGLPRNADDVHGILNERFHAFESMLKAKGIDYIVIRRTTKVVSLQHMLNNMIIVQKVIPNEKITLNSRIGSLSEPLGRSFRDSLNREIASVVA
jgi:hypothetical protein